MRCPNCNEEIKEGYLYCQKCGYEVQIVPDYNPIVEDVLSGSLKDVFVKKQDNVKDAQVKAEKPDKKHVSKRKLFLVFLLAAFVVCIIVSVFLRKERADSYEYQYGQAAALFDKMEYGKAQEHLDRAMELNPDQKNAWILQMRLYEAMGDAAQIRECYEYILSTIEPDNQEIYIKLVNSYIDEGDFSKVKEMLSECKVPSVLSYFEDYIVEVPKALFPEGLYYDSIQVELDAGENDIYFTTDGSKPTVNSTKYEGIINLGVGTTTIRAIAVTKAGVQSDEAIFNYEVSYLESEMPEVSPESGQYPKELEIVVIVPDGCTVLYTLDGSVPTLDSMVYEGPILIRQSTVFTAVSVSLSEHLSEAVVRNYVITP